MPYILYIEDNPTDVALLKHQLADQAIAAGILHVETPQAFLSTLEYVRPDVILADGNVPGFDTTAALRAAREHCPEVPFYYLTGNQSEERSAAIRAAGATGCLYKGDQQSVASAIRGALSRPIS
jgi:CheY-like chemotaxis protein